MGSADSGTVGALLLTDPLRVLDSMDSRRHSVVTPLRPNRRAAQRPKPAGPATLRALPRPTSAASLSLDSPALYINRELSWLEFNERVLAQAHDASHPLLERVKFLAINASNLDEFFMIRVSMTLKKIKAGIEDTAPDGLRTDAQLAAMRTRSQRMLDDQASTWHALRSALTDEHITFTDADDWTPQVRAYLADHFEREIAPVLTPIGFEPGRPFPSLSNLSKSFAVVVQHAGRTRFARVEIPAALPRFVPIPDRVTGTRGQAFAFLEDVIRANIQMLFGGAEVQAAHLFRIVRDSDLEVAYDEADDLVESVDRSLQQLRHGAIALLQVETSMPVRVLSLLLEGFEAPEDVVIRTANRIGFAEWRQLLQLHRPDLKDAPLTPRALWRRDEDPQAIFDQIRYQDVLVHHPYESFATFESFLKAATDDPHVVAIKTTLYRVGENSPLIDLLIDAAAKGKQVVVLVEIKARLDERTNIRWARRLEAHGVHVVHGFHDVKTHAKLCLVVRQESEGLRGYLHTSSGNYNAETARVYTDLGLFTADPDIVADASELFNHLTGYAEQPECRSVLVAPSHLRAGLVSLIDREMAHARAGRKARIVIKINAITDDAMIRRLYRASQAGVQIDLLVRGICSLRPGVRGVSDNIRVRSIVGRFLEHSRVYWFENGGQEEMYIGSADLMERNLRRRVEVLTPVRDEAIRTHVKDVVLDAYLRDTVRAMTLDSSGRYARPSAMLARFDAQAALMAHYAAADRG
jgi:polyphosphate kinase